MERILGKMLYYCYILFKNYGVAIMLFTFISKIILLPISIWVQKNSIKMVKMQPEINKLKIKYFGDKDSIADEESKLYKKYKYNPLASIIPLIIQIILLLGLVKVINKPMTYILKIDENALNKYEEILLKEKKDLSKDDSLEVEIIKDIKNNGYEKYLEVANEKELEKIKNVHLSFLGFDLTMVAANEKGIAFLIPIIAGVSALILCIGQNMMNPLQKEQSNYNKYGMLILSVFLSLYLGLYVSAGVALYWTVSNLFAIFQQWVLNIFINPKKHVNYEELEKTRLELHEIESSTKKKRTKEEIKKERQDYKKFFNVVNKHLVFYSESNGFYKYYRGIIEYLLQNTNITIHYVTSDYNDDIFKLAKENSQIRAYYIEERKLITLMMKLDCDVMVMTMPDLENFHIKRSYIRKDIEYIYIPHAMDSLNMTMRYKATDNYDTVFLTGKHLREEMEKVNQLHHLPNRKLFDWGYSLLDEMILEYEKNKTINKEKVVLIAPSWQKDNIIDLCLDELLDNLKGHNYHVIVRPHPQHVRHMKEKFELLKEKYQDDKSIEIQTDFSSNNTVFNADLLITDWSGICYEYAFTTKKPVLFINTPMKIMNPNYEEIKVEPINIWCRTKIGEELDLKDLNKIDKLVDKMLKNQKTYQKKINDIVDEYVYNLGKSGEVGAEYIIKYVQDKIEERRKDK